MPEILPPEQAHYNSTFIDIQSTEVRPTAIQEPGKPLAIIGRVGLLAIRSSLQTPPVIDPVHMQAALGRDPYLVDIQEPGQWPNIGDLQAKRPHSTFVLVVSCRKPTAGGNPARQQVGDLLAIGANLTLVLDQPAVIAELQERVLFPRY
jgi:hypothetical protein